MEHQADYLRQGAMPGDMSHEEHMRMMQRATVPAGWNYCPATWLQRIPIAILGLIGFFLARYIAAYQMGHIDDA
jgi:hypothetical protein